MKLADNEIRDINKHIEAGKTLPEKYRFILFDDKRETELVWNGKTGEVCNVVLPFQTIEQVDEPRAEDSSDYSFARDRCLMLMYVDASSKAGPTSSSGATTNWFSPA